jgi:F-type H+-transporting ATPase subunit delta
MFHPDHWARAFTELCGKDLDEGIAAFNAFMACTGRFKNPLGGSNKALRLEALLRQALKEAGFNSADLSGKVNLSRDSRLENRGAELALRFIVFLVKKDYFKYRYALLAEIEKAANRARGIARVVLESAAPVDDELENKIKAELIRRTGAQKIMIDKRIVPDLIGGYRVYIGTELLDTSFKGLMYKMAVGLGVPVNGKTAGDPVDSVWEIV